MVAADNRFQHARNLVARLDHAFGRTTHIDAACRADHRDVDEGDVGRDTLGLIRRHRLNTPVAAIEQHDDHVVVTTRDGEALAARAVVVTIPLNVLHDVTFDPPLSETKQGGITLGQAGIGSKLMLRVKGHSNSINALADEHPFSYIGTLFDDVADDEQVLVCFGHDGDEIHADDLGWAQRELDRLVPGLTVLEINFHDWKADEFSQGTWAAHRPGWYTNYHAEMQRPEGRIILANSDFADGWAGFVDGALESGKRGGRWAAAHC